jgi:predicted O-methyltransferase YrrM
MTARAHGTAIFHHKIERIDHHQLDPTLEHLAIEVGGCPVEISKAVIVSRFCKLLRPKKVLEIGTYHGGMTYHIARNTPDDCHIWTLDLPRDKLPGLACRMIDSDVRMASESSTEVGQHWLGTREAAKITQLWGDSMAFSFAGLGPMDLIYIDGSHAEPWVAKDTENAFKLLGPTGAILWDDCLWRDVQRVLGRFGRERPIYRFEDGHTAGYLQRDGSPVRISR